MATRTLAVLACAVVGVLAGVGASASTKAADDVVRFDRTSGNHPTAVHRIVVNGNGCLNGEDSASLRLDNWDPANDRVVYHCVQP